MYVCAWCAYPIPKGWEHVQQFGYYCGEAQANRFHNECFSDLLENSGEEFTPGYGEPPEAILKWTEQEKQRKVYEQEQLCQNSQDSQLQS